VGATLPNKLDAIIPDPVERQEAVDDIVDTADPHAVVGLVGPGKPISDVPASEIDGVVDAADDAFVEGIRAALATAAGLLGLTLIVGFVIFPRGRKEVADDVTEELELAAGETS
jgi:hypothetical protein